MTCLSLGYSARMMHGKKIIVVMPAYNAAKTLPATYADIPKDIVDEVLLVDDNSTDDTPEVARALGIETVVHPKNRGYGGNQKTCYATALAHGAEVVIMVHPDYQYDPRLIPAMCSMITCGTYDAVIGSRILCGTAIRGGMPIWKYASNRFLTLVQNALMGAKLSEYHTGYRAFSREVLQSLPLASNSEDFLFDNQMLAQILMKGFRVGEISCPTKYFPEASSINLRRSITYGLGVLKVSLLYRLHRLGILRVPLFSDPV